MPREREEDIHIGRYARIDPDELVFDFARSSGPGGQNVNKVNTRVTLRFDLAKSPSLTAPQKERIQARLPGRISREGVLRVISSRHRTQGANRLAAVERFVELLEEALHVERPRCPTRVPTSTKRRRVEDKARRGRVKKERSEVALPQRRLKRRRILAPRAMRVHF